MKFYLLILLTLIIFSCKKDQDCEIIYKQYIELRMSSNDDKAFVELDKAINCDTANIDYRFEKINYLISMRQYNDAKTELQNLGKLDNSYVDKFPLLGLLKIKIGRKEEGILDLKKVHNNLSKTENRDFNFNYYKLLLDVFFEGKSSVAFQLQKQNFSTDDNEKAVIGYLKKLVNSDMDSLNILYKSFQIK
jgi:hypothetical protein